MSCPSGKVVYATPGEAARIARTITNRNRRSNAASKKRPGDGNLAHYRCPMCGE